MEGGAGGVCTILTDELRRGEGSFVHLKHERTHSRRISRRLLALAHGFMYIQFHIKYGSNARAVLNGTGRGLIRFVVMES